MKPNRIVILLASRTQTDLDWRVEEKYRDLGNALERAGFVVETATWRRNNSIALETQLLGCAAVLVWVNPVERNLDVGDFEEMLLRVQASGTYISADPRVIQKIGTKSVLVSMAGTPWVPEAVLHSTEFSLRGIQKRLDAGVKRVTKQHRGNDGLSVYKLEKLTNGDYLATEANSLAEIRHGNFEELVRVIGAKTSIDNPTIEVPWNESIANGVVRCYFCVDRVAGFGFQEINALYPLAIAPEIKKQRFYLTDHCSLFSGLKRRAAEEFVPDLCHRAGVMRSELPILWDADFFIEDHRQDLFQLCEINASCVSPFPPSGISHVVDALKVRASMGCS